ncbi:LAMI_0E05732g1_1 [Lachancea mirantina]|uniref:LAMI_0E05732g1_1 n=1 Tax=Lachancea mirantina TaxID=1230905 RepID=A0A1G4JLB2_9SACH|nr:LAMI_0E05732g1_1 [Lachancea mirantina]
MGPGLYHPADADAEDETDSKDQSPIKSSKASDIPQKRDSAEAHQQEVDSRSVFVGKIPCRTTPEMLAYYFSAVGTVNRVTILVRKRGVDRAYAYVEFEEKCSVPSALRLHDSIFAGETIVVFKKRTNKPNPRSAQAINFTD